MARRKPRGMDRVEWRMCRRKTRYQRKSDAVIAAGDVPSLRPYQCLLCHYWHLTSKPERQFASEWLVGRYT